MFYKLYNWLRSWFRRLRNWRRNRRLCGLFGRKSNHTVPDFSRFALPLIRQVYPSLIAANLVQVQPMPAPSGMVFWQNSIYPERKLAGFCNIIGDYEFLKVDNDIINDPNFEPIFAYVYGDDGAIYLISLEDEGHPVIFSAEEESSNKIVQADEDVPDDIAKILIEKFRTLI